MAKIFHRKARKDYPDNGVKKGDMYYYTKIKTGPYSSRVMRQLTKFKRSQLTSSAFLSSMYEIEDNLAAASDADTVRSVIDDLENLRDETQESFDNMPEGLQQGHTGEMLEERVQGCETAIDELTDICDARMTSPLMTPRMTQMSLQSALLLERMRRKLQQSLKRPSLTARGALRTSFKKRVTSPLNIHKLRT